MPLLWYFVRYTTLYVKSVSVCCMVCRFALLSPLQVCSRGAQEHANPCNFTLSVAAVCTNAVICVAPCKMWFV